MVGIDDSSILQADSQPKLVSHDGSTVKHCHITICITSTIQFKHQHDSIQVVSDSIHNLQTHYLIKNRDILHNV